jgi:hypothetical protein
LPGVLQGNLAPGCGQSNLFLPFAKPLRSILIGFTDAA